MADFVQKSLNMRSVRKLTAPIADLPSLVTLIQNVLDMNPWECTDYTQSGATVDGVIRISQSFSGKVSIRIQRPRPLVKSLSRLQLLQLSAQM